MGTGTIDSCSVRPRSRRPGQAHQGFRASGKGDCRAVPVTTEQDLALGHPILAQSLSELCHQRLIPPSELEDWLSREDALYPAWGLILTYSQGTSETSPVRITLYVVQRKGAAEPRGRAAAGSEGCRLCQQRPALHLILSHILPSWKRAFAGTSRMFPDTQILQ